ncbi:hypothetical protein [Priestia megaterium]|uniref:hypothetical protein n=1 Tax=Priestia megaterium TaxID=1404 RepID=UPI00186764FD|nr:hypothetical protein [Priestia megaterium]MBE2977118.1 hypothetical protein [Priestia megaterium]
MNDSKGIFNDKERKLARYLETYTTEQILTEAGMSSSTALYELKKIRLPRAVANTIVYYVLATNNQKLVMYKLLMLAGVCKKLGIQDAQAALTFIKKYYVCHQHLH